MSPLPFIKCFGGQSFAFPLHGRWRLIVEHNVLFHLPFQRSSQIKVSPPYKRSADIEKMLLHKILFIEHAVLVVVAIFTYRKRKRLGSLFEIGKSLKDCAISTRRQFRTVGTSRKEQNRTDQ